MDLSLPFKKAKLGGRETGRTRSSREKARTRRKKTGTAIVAEIGATWPRQRSENRPKGAPRVLFAAMIAIGSGRSRDSSIRFSSVPREPVAERHRKKDPPRTAVSPTNDSYMSIQNRRTVLPFSPFPAGPFAKRIAEIGARADRFNPFLEEFLSPRGHERRNAIEV